MTDARDLQAVLFDMDGTICDTEPCWMRAEHAMARRYGTTWSEADAYDLVGNDLYETGAVVRQKMGLDHLTPEQVVHELIDHLEVEIEQAGITWLPGALELIDECNAGGVPVALVTMSWERNAGPVLEAMPRGRFDVVVTGDEVQRGKPHPDPYLRAAELLRVDAARCVAIEDSPTGAASAQAAGCTVLAVPNHVVVPVAERRIVRPEGLAGVTLDELRRLHAR